MTFFGPRRPNTFQMGMKTLRGVFGARKTSIPGSNPCGASNCPNEYSNSRASLTAIARDCPFIVMAVPKAFHGAAQIEIAHDVVTL